MHPGIKLWLPSYSLSLAYLLKGKPAINYGARSSVKRLTPQRNEGGPRAAISDELRFSRPWIQLTTTWISLNPLVVLRWLQSWMISSLQLGGRLNQRHPQSQTFLTQSNCEVSVCFNTKLCSNLWVHNNIGLNRG